MTTEQAEKTWREELAGRECCWTCQHFSGVHCYQEDKVAEYGGRFRVGAGDRCERYDKKEGR